MTDKEIEMDEERLTYITNRILHLEEELDRLKQVRNSIVVRIKVNQPVEKTVTEIFEDLTNSITSIAKRAGVEDD